MRIVRFGAANFHIQIDKGGFSKSPLSPRGERLGSKDDVQNMPSAKHITSFYRLYIHGDWDLLYNYIEFYYVRLDSLEYS